MRAVLELAGIRDILSKSLGTTNPVNLVAATVAGLKALRRPEEVAALRDKTVAEVLGIARPAPAPRPPSPSARPRNGNGRREPLAVTQVRSRSARSSATAARCAPWACARSGRRSSTRTRPSSRACSAGSPGSSAWRRRMAERPDIPETPAEDVSLDKLSPRPGAKRARKRIGRGIGSGTGKTSGRGQKGLGARSGGGVRPGYHRRPDPGLHAAGQAPRLQPQDVDAHGPVPHPLGAGQRRGPRRVRRRRDRGPRGAGRQAGS